MKRLTRLAISGGLIAGLPGSLYLTAKGVEQSTIAHNQEVAECADALLDVAEVTYDLEEPCKKLNYLFGRAANLQGEGAEAPYFVPPRHEFLLMNTVTVDPGFKQEVLLWGALAGVALGAGGNRLMRSYDEPWQNNSPQTSWQ